MSHGGKCSHDENRKKVCAPCGRKIVYGKIKPEKYLINEKTADSIKKFVSEDFHMKNEKYPLSICRSCYLTLRDRENNIFKRPIPSMPNYNDIVLQKQTRSFTSCDCFICSTATQFGHAQVIKGRGNCRVFETKIDVTQQNSILPKNNDKEPNVIKLCSKCFQQIGKGINHDCKNPKENLLKLVEKVPDKNKEQIASTIIKNKCESENETKSDSITLATNGRKRKLIIDNSLQKQISFSEERLDNLRVSLGVSQNQMRQFANFIRSIVGRKSIPKNYSQHMSTKSKELKDIYKVDFFEFDCENSPNKQKRPVVYADAEELLDTVIIKRKLEGNCDIKVLADGGQGFFKISLTVLPENYSPKSNSTDDESDEDSSNDSSESKKRSLYSEGGTLSKKGKLTSVDKLILLCIVPQVKETYDNFKLLVELTKLNNISFKFVADFKLLLIINGQQTATSMYPCPYCFVSLSTLRGDSVPADNSNVNSTTNEDQVLQTDCMQLKTYGDLRADYQKYCLSGKNKKLSRDCHSTINLPIFTEDEDVYVLQKCIIPELHILQGFVNHLFWRGLVQLLGKEKALLWPTKLGLISKNYHGDAFEGNACRTLLKEADKLNDPEIDPDVFKVLPYISAFKAMNKIVDCCFTSGKVKNMPDAYIEELDTALKSIEKLSKTLKIHIILSHIKESLLLIENNNGLGYWSEQSGESVHRDFLKFWRRYMLSSIHHKSYPSQLLKAVTEFSSLHL